MNKIKSRKEQLKRAKQTTKRRNCHKQLRPSPVYPFRQNPPNANVNKRKGKKRIWKQVNKQQTRGKEKKDEKSKQHKKALESLPVLKDFFW